MDTKIIETPIEKHKVEVKLWLTGLDRRALRSVYVENAKIEMVGDKPEIKNISGSLVDKAEDKAIEIMVVSVDGNSEDIVKRILEMKDEDCDFVIKSINEITNEKKTI
ncbi:MAG: hypothetical protein NTY22_07675 [Proteobacteria bacterium]|nr:hypothetical protein [Pseudomonadota bacterium]